MLAFPISQYILALSTSYCLMTNEKHNIDLVNKLTQFLLDSKSALLSVIWRIVISSFLATVSVAAVAVNQDIPSSRALQYSLFDAVLCNFPDLVLSLQMPRELARTEF